MILLKGFFYRAAGDPTRLTFFFSIILSLIAVFGIVTIGKDGALYVDVARSISNHGLSVAFDKFDWPWYSILIAVIYNITKIEHEIIAYTLAVFFMAGTCSMIVSLVNRRNPEAVYWAMLLVLSIPVFNAFRADIIRDTGFWFFTVLTLWLILSDIKVTFSRGLLVQLSIVCAALCRLEALFIGPAIFIYLLASGDVIGFRNRVFNIFKTFSVFFVLFVIGTLFIVSTSFLEQPRISANLHLINPSSVYYSFLLVSDSFAQVALAKWSHSDATVIVFFGFLAALIIRIIGYAGIISFVLLDLTGRKALVEGAKSYKLNSIAILLYFLVLLVFFFQNRFINSRYLSMLLILSVPILSVVIYRVKLKWPRLVNVFVVLSVFMMFSNVVSTSTKKTHYIEAAQWIENSTKVTDRIYYDDSRVSYYAGRGYPFSNVPSVEEVLNNPDIMRFYDYFVIESSPSGENLLLWIETNELAVVAKKTNGKKTIFILSKESTKF